jgi:hypothetical protein
MATFCREIFYHIYVHSICFCATLWPCHSPIANAITSPFSEGDYEIYNKRGGMIAVGA